MSSFADLAAQLAGRLPGLSPFLAETFITQGWEKIRNQRLWSFLVEDTYMICPAQITAGLFNFAQYSTTAIGNTAARTALLAQNTTGQPLVTQLQIRFQGAGQTSQIYQITAVDFTTAGNTQVTITTDRPILEPTNTGSNYLVYRCYIRPPVADFMRFISLTDMNNGYTIEKSRLVGTSQINDLRDPQRQALGMAYWCYFYKFAVAGRQPIYELWPGPTNGQQWWVKYRRRGLPPNFVDATNENYLLPDLIPDDLLIQYVLWSNAYPFAKANAGHFPAFRSAQWASLIEVAKGSYDQQMIDTKRQDDNQATQSVLNKGRLGYRESPAGFYGPIDAKFIQSHAITW